MENLDLDKDAATIQKSLDPLGEDIDARITVIDSKGDVVADTKKDPEKLDNHMNRPEVTDILKKGKALVFQSVKVIHLVIVCFMSRFLLNIKAKQMVY